MLGTESVTFRRTNQDGTILTVEHVAHIYRASRDAHIDPGVLQYTWAVTWPSLLHYGNGTPISANDCIIWSELGTNSDGTTRRAVLYNLRKSLLLGRSTAYFKEPA